MKRTGILLISLFMCLISVSAFSDGSGAWVYSRMNGWMQMATYAREINGYMSTDGYGGGIGSDAYSVTVISKNASVWAEPRTNSKKLTSAAHGHSLVCRSDNGGESLVYENGFYGVVYNGRDGWVNEDYVVLNNLTITLLESNVPAYIAPDTASKKVGSLSKLTKYRVIGFYDDFYIINLRDAAAAYVPMSVMHRDNVFDMAYLGTRGLNIPARTRGKAVLRTGPGSRYPEIRTLNAGASVTVCDVVDDWYMVLDSQSGEWAFLAPDSLDTRL